MAIVKHAMLGLILVGFGATVLARGTPEGPRNYPGIAATTAYEGLPNTGITPAGVRPSDCPSAGCTAHSDNGPLFREHTKAAARAAGILNNTTVEPTGR